MRGSRNGPIRVTFISPISPLRNYQTEIVVLVNDHYPAKYFAVGLTIFLVVFADSYLVLHHAGKTALLLVTLVLAPIIFISVIMGGAQLLLLLGLVIMGVALLLRGLGAAATWLGEVIWESWETGCGLSFKRCICGRSDPTLTRGLSQPMTAQKVPDLCLGTRN